MSIDTGNRYGNVLDPQGLTRLKADLQNPTPETAREVARQFESLFVGQMLKAMRAATPGDSLLGSSGESQYRDLFDQQIAMTAAQGRGLGLAPVIERQLLANMGIENDSAPPLNTSIEDYPRLPSARRAAIAAAAAASGATTADGATRSAAGRNGGEEGAGGAASVAGSTRASPEPAGKTPASGAGSKGPVFSSPEEFVKSVWNAASRAAEVLGVPVKAIVAQAALETGWGKHVIRDGQGNSSFNLFGIKSHRGWNGDSVKVPTLEYRDGVAAKEMASFRSYGSLEEAFEDYARFLQSNPRYQRALQAGEDADAYVQGLQEAGYATDPRYADKIRRIMNGPTLSAATPEHKQQA